MNKIKLALAMSVLIVSNIALADLNNGLIAYYPFNGNADDESGNSHHGIVNNAILTADKNNEVASAYSFDGDGDSIELPNITINGLNELSFSAWFKSADKEEGSLVSSANQNMDNEFLITPMGKPSIVYFKNAKISRKAIIKPNSWYHITVVRNSKTGKALFI